jgi:PAS domain S-box-containing protein
MSQSIPSVSANPDPASSEEIARLRFALVSSGLGTWDMDIRNDIIYLDARCQELFGASSLIIPGFRTLLNIVHPDDRELLRAAANSALQPDCQHPYDVKFRTVGHDDGVVRWLHCRGQAYFDTDNKPVRFSGVAFDISRENRAEQRTIAATELETEASVNSQRNAGLQEQVKADIPKQIKDRQHLVESEARFRSLIEEAPVATCLFVGLDFTIEVANQSMIDLWGKGAQVLGKPLMDAVPELINQPFPAILEDVFKTGKTYSARAEPARLVRNGVLNDLYFDFTYKPLRNSRGEIYGIMEMAVEVTEQVLARKKLEESELFARTVFENSPVAKLVFVGPEMTIKSVNRNMLAMLGRDEAVIGKPIFEAIPELNSSDLPDILRKVFTTGQTFYGDERQYEVLRNGKPSIGFYNSIYKALIRPDGDIYGIIVTATEITEQVSARKKILEAEESLRQAVELAQLGTWSYEIESATMIYGRRMRNWFGFGESEHISIQEAYERVFIDDQEQVAAALRDSLDPAIRADYDVEYRIRDENDNERILHSQGKAFFNDRGLAYRVSGTAQDVTAQRKVQAALEQEVRERTAELNNLNEELLAINEELQLSNERLSHSNEELAQYAYVASHDLQEPLRKIRLFSDMLYTQLGESAGESYLVNKIIRSSERMTMLIRDLLEFSRLLKSDRLMRPVNLAQVAEAVINDFELTISEKKAEVSFGKLPVIEAVNLQMNQLFYNLLGNALKFSNAEKAPVIRIDSKAISHDDVEKFMPKALSFTTYQQITFSDNGIGFAPEYKEQIFEVFKRLHGRDMYPGSGIGLALCRRIVANHQGHLYAESTPEVGTTFHIILPVKQQNIQSTLPANFTWPEK